MVIVLLVIIVKVVKECSDIPHRIICKGLKPSFDSLPPLITLFERGAVFQYAYIVEHEP